MDSKSMQVYEGKDYGIRLEYNTEYVIFHLPYVNKFTKNVLMSMRVKLNEWLDFFRGLGYNTLWTAIDPTNTKLVRLLPLLGFSKVGEADSLDVYNFKGLN